MENKTKISIEDFQKVEIKIGEILSVEKVEGSDKLLKLSVSFGEDKRCILSGISKYFENSQDLVGKKCAFVTNLEPRKIMGLESQAMILAVSSDNFFSLLETSKNVTPGSTVK